MGLGPHSYQPGQSEVYSGYISNSLRPVSWRMAVTCSLEACLGVLLEKVQVRQVISVTMAVLMSLSWVVVIFMNL